MRGRRAEVRLEYHTTPQRRWKGRKDIGKILFWCDDHHHDVNHGVANGGGCLSCARKCMFIDTYIENLCLYVGRFLEVRRIFDLDLKKSSISRYVRAPAAVCS